MSPAPVAAPWGHRREPSRRPHRQTGMSLGRTLALAAVLAIAGCGGDVVAGGPVAGRATPTPTAATSRPPTPAPAPPPASPSASTVTVTAGLRETTVQLRQGQTLVVRPTPGRPGRANAVLEPGGAVLRSAGGDQFTGWRFTAVGRGTARIGIVYGPQCVPGELCPMFRGLIGRVTVHVV